MRELAQDLIDWRHALRQWREESVYHRGPEVTPEVNSVQRWAVAVFVGLVLLFFADGYYPPIDENTVYGLAVGLMLVNCGIPIGIVFSPGLRIHTAVFKKIVVAITIGSSLLAVVVFFNGKLDRGQPVQRDLLIEKRSVLVGARSTAYEFTLESWRIQGGTERLSVSYEVYSSHHVGDRLTLLVHPGAFGFPWYEHKSW